MSRSGRYWIFFVIVATGLALSWSQVGRKTERVLGERALVYLVNDADCRPLQAPCAAVAHDRAMVLGPSASGLLLKSTGIERAAVSSVRAQLVDVDGEELTRRALITRPDGWYLPMPQPAAARVRILLETASDTTAAEFPLFAGVSAR
ncbi:MAG: hypothetical protein KDI82_11970 [Gammaproteobacteria bacterium]|nr:hypothetical protein [Gammaproteobacteria bacterium]